MESTKGTGDRTKRNTSAAHAPWPASRASTSISALLGASLALVAAILLGVAGHTAQAFQPRPAPRVTAGSEIDFPPYAFVDSSGRARGYSIDLLEAVTRATGLTARVETGPWELMRRKLETGQIDVVPFMAVSEERALSVDFTAAHLELRDAIFVREGDQSIATEADLRDKDVIVMAGDSADDWLSGLGIARRIIHASTTTEALALLASGKGDAVVCARISGLYQVADKGLTNVRALPSPIEAYSRSFAFAVRKGDVELRRRLDAGLSAVRASGQYHRIYDRWFQELDPKLRQSRELRKTLLWLLWGGIVVAGLLYLRVRLLRRERDRYAMALESAREELRAQSALHAQLLDTIADHIVVRRANGSVVWANRSYRAFHGLPEDAFESARLPLIPEKMVAPTFEENERLVFEAGRTVSLPERSLTSRCGGQSRTLLVQTNVSPARDAHGNVLLAVSVSRDVTERRMLETSIEEQRQKILASAKMTALGEMSCGIAHEINSPLTVIYGRARLLQTLAEGGAIDASTITAEAKRIEVTTERISRIIKSLRTFAREADGDPAVDVALSTVIEETLEFCQERFAQQGVRLDVSLPATPPAARCRPVQVSQILLNLLNNAFDATEGRAERWTRIDVREEGETVVLEVRDSGPGVPRSLRDKIFQPFFTTKDVGKGTGLGLSVSKGLAEGQGGRLECEEIEGRCVFVLRLPRAAATIVTPPTATMPTAA